MTLIKCCGMFRPKDIAAVNDARPDYCGFVVNFPASHRNVSVQELQKLRGMLDPGIKAVGVFVNEEAEEVAQIAESCALDAVQLHGDEDEAYLDTLRTLTTASIVKAFTARTEADLEAADRSSADMILLDSGKGSGAPFDWSLLQNFRRPYFLAGGLTPENIPQAIEKLDPYALDLSSGLETDKKKDAGKIREAVQATRRNS